MITNFEEFTYDTTPEERNYILPRLIRILSTRIGKDKAITNNDIVNEINHIVPIYYALVDDKIDKARQAKTSGPRIRHLIHLIRVNDMIPYLVANSNGYYISNDMNEVNDYIQSLEERVISISKVLQSLRRQVKNYDINKQPIQGKLIM